MSILSKVRKISEKQDNNINTMKNIWIIALLSMVLGFVSCSGDDDPENDIDITSISLDKTSVSLSVNGEIKLVATIISDVSVTITWKSSDNKVVTVDSEGNIKGIKIGTAVITASVGKKSATCNVAVTDIQNISINETSPTLRTTDRITLTATTTPAGNISVSWSSSDSQVAVVDEKGILTATGRGTAVITASVGDKSATRNITVSPSVIVAGNDINDRSFLLINGEEFDVASDGRIPNIISSVSVYEGKIYISGTKREAAGSVSWHTAMVGILQPKLNGSHERAQEPILMETTDNSFGRGVFVSDGDVYVVGHEIIKLPNNSNYYRAVSWKNGKRQYLSNNEIGEQYAYSVYVSGNDMYAAGDGYRATVWKGNIDWRYQAAPQYLTMPSGLFGTNANSVFVSGNDVYVAGKAEGKPALWKNGESQTIECEHGTGVLYSVYVSGNDAYALGLDANDKVLWKNGVKHMVYHEATNALSSLFVYDGDIYVGGSRGFWINEEKQPYGTTGVESIFVK